MFELLRNSVAIMLFFNCKMSQLFHDQIEGILIRKNVFILCQVESVFVYVAQHKSQFASRCFTICTAYDTLCQ